MNRWLNFRDIKQNAPMTVVLQHYGWKCLRRRGDQVEGCCPIHGGQRVDAFHADLRNHGFHCFSCQAHGSVLDLVAAMERCTIRQAARLLEDWFGMAAPCSVRGVCHERKQELIREKERVPEPLRFSLRPLDSGHGYLRQRNIHAETAAHFGIGYYAGPGWLHGRVVVPIHNERGQLLAYAGRSIDDVCPKYKLPAGFPKSTVLFNLHRATARKQDTVVVVERFFDCLKVHQAGQPSVVALMGCHLSAEQEELLLERFSHIVLMLDGDPAGQRATLSIADQLLSRSTIDVVSLPDGRQPDQMSGEDIQRVLSAAVRRVQAARK